MLIQRVVVGVDGSAGSDAALRWVAEMAKETRAKVTAVHAMEPPYDYPPTDDIATRFHDGWRKSIRAQFENVWCKPLQRARVQYQAVLAEGRAASSIAKVADEAKGDLIVVGRRGRSAIAQLLLGSVSNELVQTSMLPVLVIGPSAARKGKPRTA